MTGIVIPVNPVEDEAVTAVQIGQIQHAVTARRARPAIDDIGLAGRTAAGPPGPDDQIIITVTIDIPRRRHGPAGIVKRVDPGEDEAATAVQRGEIESAPCARRARPAIDDIGLAGPIPIRVGPPGPDDQIIITVTIDIPRRGDGPVPE